MTLRFGIGESQFSTLVHSDCAIVDKTLFIRKVMTDPSSVMLFTRPRRFGKTLNMTMLQEFLSLGGPQVFDRLNISQDQEFCLKHQNQYPVLFLSFKDCKGDSYEALYKTIEQLMSDLYSQYVSILEGKILAHHKEQFEKTMKKQLDDPHDLQRSLVNLIRDLSQYTGKKVIVLIDEYDTPIHSAYAHGFYPQIVDLMRVLFGAALKDNKYLEKAVLTGITRVAKESMFSGLNNLEVYTILDEEFAADFGFTEDEVRQLIPQEQGALMETITQWYNGYTFGDAQIYNPWSILNCLKRKGRIDLYWINTAENHLLFKMIEKAPTAVRSEIMSLIGGKTTTQDLNDHLELRYLDREPQAIWTLLIHSGYLNVAHQYLDGLQKRAVLSIPNNEVLSIYQLCVARWFETPEWEGLTYQDFGDTLKNGNIERFAEYISTYIMQSGSCFDFSKNTPEMVFHVFILGILIQLKGQYEIISNREIGLGRADLVLIPKEAALGKNAIIIEFKACKQASQLESLAKEALLQIQTRQYAAPIKGPVLRVGMAFCGKQMQYQWDKI